MTVYMVILLAWLDASGVTSVGPFKDIESCEQEAERIESGPGDVVYRCVEINGGANEPPQQR